jgi:hypothetical protein
VHFGLGDTKKANIEVLWPSGTRQSLNDIQVDQILEIREPEHP